MAVINFGSDVDLGMGSLLNFKYQTYTTAGRPVTTGWTGINIGYTYWDTTSLKIVTWDGSAWQTGGTNLSGDGTSTNAGVFTLSPNVVTNAKAAQMAAHTFKGNNTGVTANAIDLTQAQLTAEINLFTSTLAGTVPASGGGTVNFLRADGVWTPAGVGDMVLASAQTNTGVKTFLDGTLALRNVANTFSSTFTNTNSAARVYTLKDASGTLAFTSDLTSFVTAVSVVTANGISGSSSGGTTPALTLTLGAITPTTVNGHTFTTGSSTFTGTAAAVYTFPVGTSSLMSQNLAETISGTKTFLNGNLALRNVANTFSVSFTNVATANRTLTLPDNSGTVALLTDTIALATSLAGGAGGQMHYQSAAGVTAMLANGTAGQILSSQGTTLAPVWITAPLGDMTLAGIQTVTGAKTYGDGKLLMNNVAGTFASSFTNTNTAARIYTLPDATGTVALTSDITAALVGGMINKGGYDAAANSPMLDATPIGGIKNGWTYTITVAGVFFTQSVQIGDVIIANVDNPTLETQWTILNKNIPDIVNSSEGVIGIVAGATQAETTTGTVDNKYISPLKLRTELNGGYWKYTAPTFGNGVLTTFAFTHGLGGASGTTSPTVIITNTATKAQVFTQVVITSTTVVTVDFNIAPTSGQYTVYIKN